MESLIASLRRPLARYRTWRDRRRFEREIAVNPAPRIVVGSGRIFPAGWIPTDIEYLNLLRPADWERRFRGPVIAAILAEHVWEHLTPADGATAAATCFRFLRPGGRLRLAVPDGFNPDPAYREWTRPGGSGAGADDHKVFHTHESLGQLLRDAGFRVELLEYFDRDGKFHHVEWDPADGMIHRSLRFDERNQQGRLGYTSLIVDGIKPT